MFSKKFPIIFIGLCVVVAMLVLGWSVFVKTEVPVRVPVVDDGVVDDVEDDVPEDKDGDNISEIDISDWRTYITPVYSIKYPGTWNADKAAPLEKITNIWIQPQNIKGDYPRISIQYFDLRKTSTSLKLQKGLIMARKHIFREESTVLINNIFAWKLSGKIDGTVQNSVIILERNDNEFFIFDFQYEEENIDLEKIFETMILSFRFL